MKRTLLLTALLLSRVVGAEHPFDAGKWIDLTHEFSNETIYWPTEPGFVLERYAHGHTQQGYFYAANRFAAAEHGGTHLDAPIHFAEKGKSSDQLSLDQLTGPAVVVDVRAKAEGNADYEISIEDLAGWEKTHGRLPQNTILLLRTGFARHWPDPARYLGTAEKGPGAVAKLHFPGLAPAAAKWLVEQRSIKAAGIDTASIDFGQSKLFETHRILFERNIPAFENVAALDELPIQGAYVVALPMKIKDGTGGPLRIIAWVRK